MKRKLLLSIFLVLCLFGAGAIGQKSKGPPVPYVDKGACPFECCTYREWNVTKPTAARKNMSDDSPIGFRMKPGEKVIGVTGVVITTQPGMARVLKKTTLGKIRLNRGDELFLLTNLGEGFSKIWYKGRIFEESVYGESAYKLIREPKSVWWVKVKNRRGQTGWSRQPENFGNMDQCGG